MCKWFDTIYICSFHQIVEIPQQLHKDNLNHARTDVILSIFPYPIFLLIIHG